MANLSFPGGASGKRTRLPMQETQVLSLGQEDPLGNLTPVFLHGKFQGQKSQVGYSPLGCKESDMTDATAAAGSG